ncbi:hypothetical protein K1719_027617 [Acacia pycnantha]|nr:hypothetical protein K1719_027617 [Acacia pycnantha]
MAASRERGTSNILLYKSVLKVPDMTDSCGLDQFLTQFEAAIESDFPNYQNHEVTDADAGILATLSEVFMEKAAEWFEVVFAINCIGALSYLCYHFFYCK